MKRCCGFVLLLLLACVCINGAPMKPSSLEPGNCLDPFTSGAAEQALTKINRDRRQGYVFSLKQLRNAYHMKHGPTGVVFYLTLDVLETKCHVLSKRDWKSCEVREVEDTPVYGQCKATVYIDKVKRLVRLYRYSCVVRPAPASRIVTICPDCPSLMSHDDESVLKNVKMALEKYNRESGNTNYFGLLNVTRASSQSGIAEFTFMDFTIQETVCSNSTDVTQAAMCAMMDCEFAHKGYCTASNAQSPEGDSIEVNCDIFEPEEAEKEKQRHLLGGEHDHSHNHTHEHTEGHEHTHGDTHEHDHAHGHGQTHYHTHEHDHIHHHDHTHENDHAHNHDHDHTHEHDHTHDHAHNHTHDHAHDHIHYYGDHHHHHHGDHTHAHEHDHDHDHVHNHTHEHDHTHDHAHNHTHDHAHDHIHYYGDHHHHHHGDHTHAHEHDHDHDHAHNHTHEHDHTHDHAHNHTHDHAHDHIHYYGDHHHHHHGDHTHAHEHDHDHDHAHNHTHEHDHTHDHAHNHTHDHAHDHIHYYGDHHHHHHHHHHGNHTHAHEHDHDHEHNHKHLHSHEHHHHHHDHSRRKAIKEPQGEVQYLPDLDRPVVLPSFPDQPELERPVIMPAFPEQPATSGPKQAVPLPAEPTEEQEPPILPFPSALSPHCTMQPKRKASLIDKLFAEDPLFKLPGAV